jgi:hypothetical protein
MEQMRERSRYRLITGSSDATFDLAVSAALDEGYELHGGPALTVSAGTIVAAQAVILPPYAATSRLSPSAAVPQKPTP